MRIGLNTNDPQSVSAAQTTKSSAAATNQLGLAIAGDKTTLSQDKVTLSALSTLALGQPGVRQNLVDRLKESINSGQYNLDPNAIADAILNQF